MATEYQEKLAEALTKLTHFPGITGEVVGRAQQMAKVMPNKPKAETKEGEDAGD